MTTIEQTGAEEVAWDLSDLYASGDDPRIESDFAEAEAAAAAFRDRYYGKVATLSAAELADGDRRARADRGDRDARPLLRAHELLHQHGRPRPRRARREARREGRRPRDAAPLLRARVGRDRGRARPTQLLAGPGARPLAPLALGAARLPPVPPDASRRRRSSRRRASRASPRGRGSTRRCSARCASTSPARTSRSRSRRRWRSSTRPTATSAAAPPRP